MIPPSQIAEWKMNAEWALTFPDHELSTWEKTARTAVPALIEEREHLRRLLGAYTKQCPAFRTRPIGAPHSEKRTEQEIHIALEDDACELLTPKES